MEKPYEVSVVDDLNVIIDFINERISNEKEKSQFFRTLENQQEELTIFTLLEVFNNENETVCYSLLLKISDENKEELISKKVGINFENGGNLLLITCKDIEVLKKITRKMFVSLTEDGFNKIFANYS